MPNTKRGAIVTYRRDEFMDFVREMYQKYPGEWMAIGINEADDKPDEVKGRIIAHNRVEAIVACALLEYHRKNPKAVVDFFSTDMAATSPWHV